MSLDADLEPLLKAGRMEQAREHCLRYCQAHQDDGVAWCRLGLIHARLGEMKEAGVCFQRSAAMEGARAEALFNLAKMYSLYGQFAQAEAYYLRVIALQPDLTEAYSNLGNTLRARGEFDEAFGCFKKAMLMQPDYANSCLHLLNPYDDADALNEAVLAFQGMMRSNVLFLLSYNVLCSPAEMLAAHREWDRVHGEAGRRGRYTHALTAADNKRRLRIGYVSPDFRRHSVSYFFEPILASHDREQVEVICYAEVSPGDAMTERLRGLADGWVTTVGMSDAALAQRIHDDGIDILIDLAGHTAHNRLVAFTYKPAPIQATYLGYFTTTGLEAMDYWLSDAVLTPADSVEQSSETLYRLPRSCVVYRAPEEAPAVAPRPAGAALTFGSFNDLSKIAPVAVERWSEILRRVPDSRLLLKARQLSDETECRKWQERFAAQGIGAERLLLRARTESQAAHLALYGEVDIALDAMPRTGGTTTAEALYMGVPVISLAGERFIERLSASMLDAVGLTGCIAGSGDEYIEKAVALATDAVRRGELRANLRERMLASALCDARGLARALEQAYRAMWQRKCDTGV